MSPDDFLNRVLPLKNKLFRFAKQLAGDAMDAEDLVQDTLLKAWDHRQELAALRNVEAWCMRLVRNRFLDQIKSGHYRATRPLAVPVDAPDERPSPYQQTETRDTQQTIRALVATLPTRQQQVLHLREVEAYSYREIADALDIDLSQVKISLFRARTALKEALTNAHHYGFDPHQRLD